MWSKDPQITSTDKKDYSFYNLKLFPDIKKKTLFAFMWMKEKKKEK